MSADAGSAAEDGSVFRLPLQTEHFFLEPLTPKDFDALYAVASDPLLWEQHPEADRWKRSKFQHFFDGGLANDLGCFVIKRSEVDGLLAPHDSMDTMKLIGVSGLATPSLLESSGARQRIGR